MTTEPDKSPISLADPFHTSELSWRVLRSGFKRDRPWIIAAAYVDASALRRRIDEVVGWNNWDCRYTEWQADRHAVKCELSICAGSQWGVRNGVSGEPGAVADLSDKMKSATTYAFRRACLEWRMGDYLKKLPLMFAKKVVLEPPQGSDRYLPWIDGDEIKKERSDKRGVPVFWLPPELPGWAIPKDEVRRDTDKSTTTLVEMPEGAAIEDVHDPDKVLDEIRTMLFHDQGCTSQQQVDQYLKDHKFDFTWASFITFRTPGEEKSLFDKLKEETAT